MTKKGRQNKPFNQTTKDDKRISSKRIRKKLGKKKRLNDEDGDGIETQTTKQNCCKANKPTTNVTVGLSNYRKATFFSATHLVATSAQTSLTNRTLSLL